MTLKEIAKATGYSVNTVSLALKRSDRVRPETAEKILQVAREMGYVPNRVARALVSGSTRLIGIVMTDLVNPHHAVTVQAMEQAARAAGYGVTLFLTNDDLSEQRRVLQILEEIRVDGVILFGAHGTPVAEYEFLSERGIPAVLLNEIDSKSVDIVASDNRAGMRQAVTHLIALGHRRIAYLAGPAGRANRAKLVGYFEALRSAGIEPDERWIIPSDDLHPASGYRAAAKMLELVPQVTAVVARVDQLALGALACFVERGLRVPQDISVVGYDNLELGAYAQPRLTSVAFAWESQAATAVEHLLQKMEAMKKGTGWTPRTRLLPARLVVRDSSGPAPDQASDR